MDPGGDQWANAAGAAAGFAERLFGDLFSQGLGQTGASATCPIDVMQALTAGLAAGVVGAFYPTAGFSSFMGAAAQGWQQALLVVHSVLCPSNE